MKKFINSLLRPTGYQFKPIKYLDVEVKRRLKIVHYYDINVLFDVGANLGQYAKEMRAFGYRNRIISFEPLNKTFEQLSVNARNDSDWTVNNYALGSEDSKGTINIAGNTDSSSILNMMPEHVKTSPETQYIGKQEIVIRKLDSIFNDYCKKGDRVMVKLDTQGYEESVIKGATKSLPDITLLQLEMSLVPLYENEMLYIEMISNLKSKGFSLYSLENGFSNNTTGKLLQVDGIFLNDKYAEK